MGYAGDILGRNTAMIMTLSLVVVGALISALASRGSPATIYTVIIAARYVILLLINSNNNHFHIIVTLSD
jgi:hypothetical protein